MTNVKGKTALITGGAMGMGFGLAKMMAADGADLVLWDMNEEKLAEAKETLEKKGGKVFTYTLDITDKDKVFETAEQVKKDAGQIDILVNNAGIIRGGPFLEVPIEDHVKTMEVNIISYFYVTKAFMQEMVDKNDGHIVNVASAAGLLGGASISSYCASKFAVVGWAESLASEMDKLGKNGIHFTTICPSFVDTGMFTGAKAPMFTPIMTTEDMVARIYKGIKKNKELVMAPLMVKSIMPIKMWGWPKMTRFFTKLFGSDVAMDDWKGRGH
jgi:all-trans-retinol dehydrogenase (NAD+)